ncbi:hypothetical protein G7Y89_g13107 [Cudoniella acicularis]|uniref:Altered inheritance of mitochondria protein 32 n=1 Tax=Cudoniella acicularis TaxID=354080 RepID=A0A8H4VWR2_9HELO|nr:hypothetical protein G7Y89_g13107 [Cudoniella acicularis]
MFLRPFVRSPWRIRGVGAPSLQYTTRHKPAAFPTISACPSPTCVCSETPELPPGLPIDHNTPLNGKMAAYAEQVLICTGKDDWESRIEDENSGDNLAADIKELLGRGGTYSDPYHNVLVTNSSLPPSVPSRSEIINSSVYLLPSFKYVPFLPRVSFDSVQALAKGYILPKKLHAVHDSLSPIHRDRLLRKDEYKSLLFGVQDVKDILVLICGHGGRDARCGVFGPVLRDEFESVFKMQDIPVEKGAVDVQSLAAEEERLLSSDRIGTRTGRSARVGLISHIGGHKFAGNVILYLPPGLRMGDGTESPLAGCGIWYGRVEPKHVEGIVRETILAGTVIENLFRGGIRKGGEILRL